MQRYIQYDQEQVRTFDQNWLTKDALIGLAWATRDILGQSYAVISGFTPAPTGPASMSVIVGGGEIYQLAQVDSSSFGSLTADTTVVMQQGHADAEQFTLTTSGLSAGQSQWVLFCLKFVQVDAIRDGDPTGGLLFYYDASNPSQPFEGPGNDGLTQPTVRQGSVEFNVVYGSPAATGSETAPGIPSGFVPLCLVDLVFGQSTINSGQIILSAPSAGTGIPSNYPYAPFLAGLLSSHHGGIPGQAPKINLATESTGTLPPASLPANLRIKLLVPTPFYANFATGSDSTGDGTIGNPWKTLLHAYDVLVNFYDGGGQAVTINQAGTDDGGLVATTPVPGASAINIVLNGGINTSNTEGIGATGDARLILTGAGTIVAAQFCIAASEGGFIDLSGVTLGAAAQAKVYAQLDGQVLITGSYGHTGNSQAHWKQDSGGQISVSPSALVTAAGSPAYSVGFAVALDNRISCSAATFAGTVTGPRYFVGPGGGIFTNGGGPTFLPGNAPGVIELPGWYDGFPTPGQWVRDASGSGNFVVGTDCPVDVTSIKYRLNAAGGGGAACFTSGSNTYDGGNGGAGGYSEGRQSVTNGQSIAWAVGAGGVGGSAGVTGVAADGGATSFGAASATGGTGGEVSTSAQAGGIGGVGSGGTINFSGGDGSDGGDFVTASLQHIPTGTGGASAFGGGSRATTTTMGVGGAPGSGGGASYGDVTVAGRTAADGIIIVEWET